MSDTYEQRRDKAANKYIMALIRAGLDKVKSWIDEVDLSFKAGADWARSDRDTELGPMLGSVFELTQKVAENERLKDEISQRKAMTKLLREGFDALTAEAEDWKVRYGLAMHERDELRAQMERLQSEHHFVVQAGQRLREERDSLRAQCEKLAAALEFYAEKSNFEEGRIVSSDIEPSVKIVGLLISHASEVPTRVDVWVGGKHAREALAEYERAKGTK
jgi:predicted nuclease with TOPRIM domain